MSLNKHIIYIPFSGVGLFDDPSNDDWLIYRINVFTQFTLRSILNQSVKPDLLWISFDGRRNNEWIKHLETILNRECDFPVLITYDGIIYNDDKFVWRWFGDRYYQSTLAQAFRMLGRSIKHKSPVMFIRYLDRLLFKNDVLKFRLKRTLPLVKEKLGDFEFALLTRLDSDDMIHRDWIKDINKIRPCLNLCLTRNKGLVYNGDKVCEWHPIRHPQFFTLCIPNRAFNSGEEFIAYWKGYISHEDAERVWYSYQMPDYQYLMFIHGRHISSVWNHPFRSDIIRDRSILKDYGIL